MLLEVLIIWDFYPMRQETVVFSLSAESLISLDHVLKKKTCAIIKKDVFLVMNTVANPSRLMF
jgi:hypothetical protein